jgi:hypothetical protein
MPLAMRTIILRVIVVSLIICTAGLIAWSTGPDEIDDHLFLSSILQHRSLKTWTSMLSSGRFTPLNGAPYNALILWPRDVSTFQFHALNSLEFVVLFGAVVSLLTSQIPAPVAYIAAFIFAAQPAYMVAVNRLFVPERTAILGLVGMLYFYNRYSRKQTAFSLGGCLICANLAIYYKEPIAGAVLVFAGSQMVQNHLNGGSARSKAGTRRLDVYLAASAIAFFFIYMALVWNNQGASYATSRRFMPWFANFIQNLRGYSLYSDPFLFFVSLPLAVTGLTARVRRKSNSEDWAESALYSGIAYAAAILLLNMAYTSYYLLPAAALVWPATVRWFSSLAPQFNIRVLAASIAVLIILCAAPTQIAGTTLVPVAIALSAVSFVSSRTRGTALAFGLAYAAFCLNSLP